MHPFVIFNFFKDTCFKLTSKQSIVKSSYLVNIETQDEMNFVMDLMIKKNIQEMYIGANNIMKRSKI